MSRISSTLAQKRKALGDYLLGNYENKKAGYKKNLSSLTNNRNDFSRALGYKLPDSTLGFISILVNDKDFSKDLEKYLAMDLGKNHANVIEKSLGRQASGEIDFNSLPLDLKEKVCAKLLEEMCEDYLKNDPEDENVKDALKVVKYILSTHGTRHFNDVINHTGVYLAPKYASLTNLNNTIQRSYFNASTIKQINSPDTTLTKVINEGVCKKLEKDIKPTKPLVVDFNLEETTNDKIEGRLGFIKDKDSITNFFTPASAKKCLESYTKMRTSNALKTEDAQNLFAFYQSTYSHHNAFQAKFLEAKPDLSISLSSSDRKHYFLSQEKNGNHFSIKTIYNAEVYDNDLNLVCKGQLEFVDKFECSPVRNGGSTVHILSLKDTKIKATDKEAILAREFYSKVRQQRLNNPNELTKINFPKQNKPLKVQDIEIEDITELSGKKYNLTLIGEGNHAKVYKLGKYVVKDLTAVKNNLNYGRELDEIRSVERGIKLISSIATDDELLNNHLVPEKVVFKSKNADHIQYMAIRMDGDAESISRKKLGNRFKNIYTIKFARDAAKAVKFLNENSIWYGNFKPENFLCKKNKAGYDFYLQDYGRAEKIEKSSNLNSRCYNGYCNPQLIKLMKSNSKSTSREVALKVKNFSGMMYTIMDFHFSEEFDDFIDEIKHAGSKKFSDFCHMLGITGDKDIFLLHKLCFGNLLSTDEIKELEVLMSNKLINGINS